MIASNKQPEAQADNMAALIAQLARIADALEKQNELLGDNNQVLIGIAQRIEDVGGCL